MNTPMQQLMDEFKNKADSLPDTLDANAAYLVFQECYDMAKSMLEKERRAIVSAFAWGNITKVQYKGQHIAGEDYYNDRYNETFNTKEK